ncbi:MAG: sulfatase [Verrucomicrobiae bacterium]|nr:sulfatase [Verrucomicrobiae bacterium]
MKRFSTLPCLLLVLFASVCAQLCSRPNVVIIYADDLGWGSLSCYGQTACQTPHLDRMAREGARLESFYVSTPSCAPSRVALLTGRYPFRTGVPSNPAPDAGRDHGIDAKETTLAELLKGEGYATKIVGKWHLGHLPQFYPTRHGFDSYFGILYSNDMRPVMLCRDEMAVEYPVVQNYLTQRYTQEALNFIEEQKDSSFFLYFPHAMPHKPLAASEDYYKPGGVAADLYASVIRELDWSVGQVLQKLGDLKLAENTLVLFASDNGPWYGGDTGGKRGMKGSSWEGGIRVPGIFWWPGQIPGGQVIAQPCGTIDVFPTLCQLLNLDGNQYHLDGYNIWPVLQGKPGPDRAVFAWNGNTLMSARKGRWKLHRTAPNARPRGVKGEIWIDERGPDGITLIAPFEQAQLWEYPSPADTPDTAPSKPMQLFDLETDPGEQIDVTAMHPDIVKELSNLMDAELATVGEVARVNPSNVQYYLGPGRIDQTNPMSIEEALRRTRGHP